MEFLLCRSCSGCNKMQKRTSDEKVITKEKIFGFLLLLLLCSRKSWWRNNSNNSTKQHHAIYPPPPPTSPSSLECTVFIIIKYCRFYFLKKIRALSPFLEESVRLSFRRHFPCETCRVTKKRPPSPSLLLPLTRHFYNSFRKCNVCIENVLFPGNTLRMIHSQTDNTYESPEELYCRWWYNKVAPV